MQCVTELERVQTKSVLLLSVAHCTDSKCFWQMYVKCSFLLISTKLTNMFYLMSASTQNEYFCIPPPPPTKRKKKKKSESRKEHPSSSFACPPWTSWRFPTLCEGRTLNCKGTKSNRWQELKSVSDRLSGLGVGRLLVWIVVINLHGWCFCWLCIECKIK